MANRRKRFKLNNMDIEWRGDELTDMLREAAEKAIRETLDNAVVLAKATVRVDSGKLRDTIRVVSVKQRKRDVAGRWAAGKKGVGYAVAQEIGPVAGNRKWGFTPYMRPSADAEYPKLQRRIAKNYKELERKAQ